MLDINNIFLKKVKFYDNILTGVISMYQDLTDEEKKSLRFEYVKTQKGYEMIARLNRLVLEGLFCLVTFVVTICAIFILDLASWYWAFVGLTLFCGILFLVGQYKIRMREYNKFYLGKYKNVKKKLTKDK